MRLRGQLASAVAEKDKLITDLALASRDLAAANHAHERMQTQLQSTAEVHGWRRGGALGSG